jgi:transposase
MGAPISQDLRRRIVEAWQREQVSPAVLASRFLVGEATARRLIDRFKKTGSVEATPYRAGRHRVIKKSGEQVLRRLLERNPDWTTYELTDAYNRRAKRRVNRSTVLRALKRLGYTL